jgi:hypothetical protein
MKTTIYKYIVGLVALLGAAGLACAADIISTYDEIQPPDLPAVCSMIEVTNEPVAFRAYAIGVQIYRWSGTSWDLSGPSATLYADDGYHGKVGTHYAGPTWESNSGSRVVGKKKQECTPDLTAIPWLLLEKVSTDGPGIFNTASHIQRVNTTGGLKPTVAGSVVGEERRVPYTAEYYFYRPE